MTPERLAEIKLDQRVCINTGNRLATNVSAELIAEVEKLQGLLKPFADAPTTCVRPMADPEYQQMEVLVTLADCRRAREALE